MFNQNKNLNNDGCCNNNVVQTCMVEELPYYTYYNTHQINNCIKRHINIPVYTNTYETVVTDEYVMGSPMYQGPVYQNMCNMYQGYNMNSNPYQDQGMNYQGNVGTDPKMNPFTR